ncbi:MAG: S-layer homology domain-containing protein, partial [Firmicutes bacterium]|nr:S-layer homology domain-containing protein [Bacillota bacterium]
EVVYCSQCHTQLSREQKTIGMLEHAWDRGTVTKAATYKETGEKLFTCTVCQAARTVEIPKKVMDDDDDDTGSSGGHGSSGENSGATAPAPGETANAQPQTGEDPAEAFSDVDPEAWYHEAVSYVTREGLMEGYSETSFGPNNELTRAQLITILWREAGKPAAETEKTFTDVPEGTWYSEAVCWAASVGITEGYGNGTFGVSDGITREQLATMLYRFEQKVNGGGFKGAWMFLLSFKDADQLSEYADEAMHWCVMNGIINGKGDGILDPKGKATRAQVAQMLMNYLAK